MTDTDEQVAQRIAERGRGALLERLRPAFEEAAATHSDLIELDSDELEQMVQRAADRADGLQWRRALASVATEELGIGLGDALGHPAVQRAQTILGAPSYEQSLAELAPPGTAASTADGPEPDTATEPGTATEPDTAIDPDVVSEDAEELAVAEAEAAVEDAEHAALEDAESAAVQEPTPAADASTVRVTAVHQGGIANLAPEEGGLELQLSHHGLDISRGDGAVLGRLPWHEIKEIDVPAPRGVRRRRKRDAQLVVKTSQGEATFSIPALTPDEFREIATPVIERNRPANGNS
jgi:hypothetical protein